MVNPIKKDELIKILSSLLEKHRDALSIDEIQAFETTIEVVKKLDDYEPKDYGNVLAPIAVNLLRFFTKPEILERLMELF